jgi:serine/threonine protein kinase
VALGLEHAHEHGMVHRDIKPSNLMLAREGKKAVVKVLDFGLAKVTSEGQGDTGLTREGQRLGTPDYIDPEQIRDAQSADIRADIYSLGCTLYYLLAGRPPFAADNLWDLCQAHFSMDAEPLNHVRPEVPRDLAGVVGKMMAKQPERRYQSPIEVAKALKPFFSPAGEEAVRSSPDAQQTGQRSVEAARAIAQEAVPSQPGSRITPLVLEAGTEDPKAKSDPTVSESSLSEGQPIPAPSVEPERPRTSATPPPLLDEPAAATLLAGAPSQRRNVPQRTVVLGLRNSAAISGSPGHDHSHRHGHRHGEDRGR